MCKCVFQGTWCEAVMGTFLTTKMSDCAPKITSLNTYNYQKVDTTGQYCSLAHDWSGSSAFVQFTTTYRHHSPESWRVGLVSVSDFAGAPMLLKPCMRSSVKDIQYEKLKSDSTNPFPFFSIFYGPALQSSTSDCAPRTISSQS